MNKKKEMKKKKEKRDRYKPPAPHCVAGPNSQWKSKERSLYILILHGLRGELNVCGFYIAADHQCSPATGREMIHLTMKRNTFHWITILANLFIVTFIHPSLLWDFSFLSLSLSFSLSLFLSFSLSLFLSFSPPHLLLLLLLSVSFSFVISRDPSLLIRLCRTSCPAESTGNRPQWRHRWRFIIRFNEYVIYPPRSYYNSSTSAYYHISSFNYYSCIYYLFRNESFHLW